LVNTENDVAIMGLFSKKLVRAAANHDLFVPVQTNILSSSYVVGSDRSILLLGILRTFVKSVVLFSVLVGTCGVGVYYFTAVSPSTIRLPATRSSSFIFFAYA
jgi:hypothetical protein